MLLTRDKKKEIIEQLKDRLERAKSVVFTDYQGLKVSELQSLKDRLREKGIDYKVVKNTLVKIALKDKNLKIDETILDKPTAVAFGYTDEVEPNKIVYKFSKENEKLEILGGIVNKEFMDVSKVKSLALLPSREELYAKVVGSIAAPLSGFINVLQGNLRGLVSVLKQYSEQKSK